MIQGFLQSLVDLPRDAVIVKTDGLFAALLRILLAVDDVIFRFGAVVAQDPAGLLVVSVSDVKLFIEVEADGLGDPG